MDLLEIFSISWLKNLAVPFLGIVLGVGIKMASRNDNIKEWHKPDDWAIGFDMMITAIIIFLINTFSLAIQAVHAQTADDTLTLSNRFVSSFAVFISLCAVLLSSSFVVRKLGFNKSVFPKEELTRFGIFFPFLLGIASLVVAGFFVG